MKAKTIQAIETSYNGYRFRSRLEARWAVFFDEMGVQWCYETQGFALSPVSFSVDRFLAEYGKYGTDETVLRRLAAQFEWSSRQTLRYLPDFFLPEFQAWAEVKGAASFEDYDKLFRWCNQGVGDVFLFGELENRFQRLLPNKEDPLSDRIEGVREYSFVRCPICRNIAIRDMCVCGNCRNDSHAYYTCPGCYDRGLRNMRVKKSLEVPGDDIRAAFTAARSARFEYGETPRVPRGRQNARP